jgi:hypothetical protein
VILPDYLEVEKKKVYYLILQRVDYHQIQIHQLLQPHCFL